MRRITDMQHEGMQTSNPMNKTAAVIAISSFWQMGKSRRSPRRCILWHLHVALAIPFVGLSLNYALKINTPLLVGILLFWAWGGYLYWVIDRTVHVWLVPSVIRGGLRAIVASLFIWCPVALGWAVLRFIDWRRRYTSHTVEYERRLHPSLLEDSRAIENLDSVGGVYIGDHGYTVTPTPFKLSI